MLTALFLAQSVVAQNAENILVVELGGRIEGRVEIELFDKIAPEHVARVKRLAREGYYDNVAFHRVIGGFMAQTGDVKFGKMDEFLPQYAGLGGSVYPDLPAEFSKEKFRSGILGMARGSDENSANSQFFITLGDAEFLNGAYTVFGKVISGMDKVEQIHFNETLTEIRQASAEGKPHANGAVRNPDYMMRVFVKVDE
ncbi:MAG: peptidylprolyl isomerase [Pseudomonadota bacterium]